MWASATVTPRPTLIGVASVAATGFSCFSAPKTWQTEEANASNPPKNRVTNEKAGQAVDFAMPWRNSGEQAHRADAPSKIEQVFNRDALRAPPASATYKLVPGK